MSARSTVRVAECGADSPYPSRKSTGNANDSFAAVVWNLTVRITATRIAELDRTLSDKDRAIIDTLARLRLATTAQLQRLHMPGVGASNARQIRRALQRLTMLRVIRRMERRVGGVRAGSAAYVYGLDVAGQHLAARGAPSGGTWMRRPWTPGLPFIAHRLDVSELYVSLVEAERAEVCELLEFAAEPFCWRRLTTSSQIVLKPDAYLRLGIERFEDHYFVEVDRATQSLASVARKLALYRRHYASGQEQERLGVFPRVLFTAPEPTRCSALADLCSKQQLGAVELFTTVCFEEATALLMHGCRG